MSLIARYDTQVFAGVGSYIGLNIPDPTVWVIVGGVLGTAMASIEMSGTSKQRIARAIYSFSAALAFTEFFAWLFSLPEIRVVLTGCAGLVAYFSWTLMRYLSQHGIGNLAEFAPFIKGRIVAVLKALWGDKT